MIYTCTYPSPLGGITLISDGEFLTGLFFDGQKFIPEMPDCKIKKDLPVFEQTANWLDIYFSKNQPEFIPPIKLDTTPFRKTVYDILLTIPYGTTMTYGEIAQKIANRRGIKRMSSQAVGGAAEHNPVSIIIPCHRVVGTDGRLTGYAGGIERKAQLLTLENSDIFKWGCRI